MISKEELAKGAKLPVKTFLRVLAGTVGSQQFERGAIFIAEAYGTNVDALVKGGIADIVTEDEALDETLTLPDEGPAVQRRSVGHLTASAPPIDLGIMIPIIGESAPPATPASSDLTASAPPIVTASPVAATAEKKPSVSATST